MNIRWSFSGLATRKGVTQIDDHVQVSSQRKMFLNPGHLEEETRNRKRDGKLPQKCEVKLQLKTTQASRLRGQGGSGTIDRHVLVL